MNPDMQYFSGYSKCKHKFPCDLGNFELFRKHIAEPGVENIFGNIVRLRGKQVEEDAGSSDTTVRADNISFVTDSEMQKR